MFDKDSLNALCEDLIVHTKNTELYDEVKNHYMSIFFLKTSQLQLEEQMSYLKDIKMLARDPKLYEDSETSLNKTLERLSQELEKKEKSLSEEKIQQAYAALKKVDFSGAL